MNRLYQKLSLLLTGMFLTTALVAQTVQGTVTGDDNEPLIGVTVLVKGTTVGTVTDFDGNFELAARPGDLLQLSYVGYTPQEVPATTMTMRIQMSTDAQALEDVVVIGYGQTRKEAITGAVGTVNAKELTQLSVANLGEAIQGRLAGVSVINQGSPGSAPIIEVRGVGSINFGTGPLVVIDGVPGIGLNQIDSRDVESVTVLKDASASAIYGSRASNGVLLVTTKRGRAGQGLRVNIEGNVGFQVQPQRIDVLNTEQYIDYAQGVWNNAISRDLDAPANGTDGPSFRQTQTNWQDAIFRRGLLTQNSASVSGGNENSRFFSSIGYVRQEGVLIGSPYERYNFRINSDHSLGKRVTFAQTLGIVYDERGLQPQLGGRTQLLQAIQSIPYQPIYNDNNIGGFSGAEQGKDSADPGNPVLAANLFDNQDETTTIYGTASLAVELLSGLSLKGLVGMNAGSFINDNRTPIYESTVLNRFNNVSQFRNFGTSPLASLQLSYNKVFGDHSIDAVLVGERQDFNNRANFLAGQFDTNDFDVLNGAQNLTGGSTRTKRVLQSQVARVSYGYKGRYLATVSGRRDGNSPFSVANNQQTFYAGALAWRISGEPFMANSPFSDLKLRGSYGQVGNDFNQLYSFQARLAQNLGPVFGGGDPRQIAFINTIANPDLRWEVTEMANVGLDAGFMNNRLNFSLEYFTREVDNLILNVPTAPSIGIPNATANVGALRNTGFEIQSEYSSARDSKFGYTVRLNVGRSNNEVLRLATEGGRIESNQQDAYTGGFTSAITRVGDPIGAFYGFRVLGIFQDSTQVKAAPTQPGAAAGDFQFADINGRDDNGELTGMPDGKIDGDDRTIIGSYLPDFFYGINFEANYGNFDMTLFFQGSQGNDIYNGMKALTYQTTRLFNISSERYENAWSPTNTDSDIPGLRRTDPNNNLRTSDYYLEDGSYLRLKNFQVGYRLGLGGIAGTSSDASVRLYASTQNLFTITGYSGLDPEIGGGSVTARGFDNGVYPQGRTFLAGAQFTF